MAHVLLGGAAIPTALTQDAEAMGIACWCGYGMTETASTVTLKRADGQDDVARRCLIVMCRYVTMVRLSIVVRR
ncbi:AMP-binding protein [Salinivibrio costicola]|uniref:AMP-binding protein n=1 Tax=Salinivibrio costicola TaxID=51367 RepID=UPI00068445EC|nr:AMP-binding protein [Salinivibrio costicola]